MEFSMLWETRTNTGDGATSYQQPQSNNYFRYFDVQDPATQGVALNGGGLDSLEVTGTAVPLAVDSGAAVCWLRYWNDAATTVTVSAPIADTGGRVILETDWATNTTRLKIALNTVGNTAVPALVQTVGTIWQIPLASFVIDSAGDVWTDSGKLVAGVNDERVYIQSVRSIDTVNIADDAVTTDKIANNAVTVDKIPDMLRRLWVQPQFGMEFSSFVSGGVVTPGSEVYPTMETYNDGLNRSMRSGITLDASSLTGCFASFIMPSDYDGGSFSVIAHITANDDGDLSGRLATYLWLSYGDDFGDAIVTYDNLRTHVYPLTHVSLSIDDPNEMYAENFSISAAIPSAKSNSPVQLMYGRDGTDGTNTFTSDIRFVGFSVEYTATH